MFKLRIYKKAIHFMSICFLISACHSNTEKVVDKSSILLPNGKRLVIDKTNRETTSTGIFSNHNYGTTHSFTYHLLINPGSVKWNGGSGEPKNIMFSNDTIYIRYLKKKTTRVVRVEDSDSSESASQNNYRIEIKEVMQQYIDNRYFFKLLGDDYWIDISAEKYDEVKKYSEEYTIPNDNELRLNVTSPSGEE